jgi:hypothetical protein
VKTGSSYSRMAGGPGCDPACSTNRSGCRQTSSTVDHPPLISTVTPRNPPLGVSECGTVRFVIKRPGTTRITVAAGIASLVGPACAVLPYTDYLPAFPIPDLAGVWLLAAIGAIGIGIGVFAFSKGREVAGTICVLTNIPVVAYWDS